MPERMLDPVPTLSLIITMSSHSTKTSPLTVLLAWVIVAVPLGWGLYQSITKSKPLFMVGGNTQPTAPATPPPK
jgi:hypothetical protein